MSTSAITSSTTAASTASTIASSVASSLSSDDFLTILLTQLQNQDPTDPVDTGEMVSSLAALTTMAQQMETNESLKSIAQYAQSSSISYIGKTVTYSNDEISVSNATAGKTSFTLASNASSVSVAIYDEDGNAVSTLDLGSLSKGTNSFTWDCTDSSGSTVDDGTYTFTVSASDTSDNTVSVSTGGTAEVTGVVYQDGNAYLVTDSGNISLDSVTGVS
jgi:flagellar basal-body rod modification protein FlgD